MTGTLPVAGAYPSRRANNVDRVCLLPDMNKSAKALVSEAPEHMHKW